MYIYDILKMIHVFTKKKKKKITDKITVNWVKKEERQNKKNVTKKNATRKTKVKMLLLLEKLSWKLIVAF